MVRYIMSEANLLCCSIANLDLVKIALVIKSNDNVSGVSQKHSGFTPWCDFIN